MRKIFSLIALTFAPMVGALTFDVTTGQGYVPKGDLQTKFGWTNAQLQSRVAGLTFSLQAQAIYRVTCSNGTSETSTTREFLRATATNQNIEYDARVQRQATGFFLTGFNDMVESTTDGFEVCPPGWYETGRVLIGETPPTLVASYGSVSVPLWQK